MNVRIRCAIGVALAAGMMFAGCATVTQPVVVGTTDDPVFTRMAQNHEAVFLLPPHMTFEYAHNEQPADPETSGAIEARAVLDEVVPGELSFAGITVITEDSLEEAHRPLAGDISARLNEECRVLLSSFRDKSALIPELNRLGEISAAKCACLVTVTVKVGTGAMYDANSGAIAQGTSSSAISIAFISLTDGSVVWKNDSFVRYLPKSGKFNKAVQMLFDASPQRRS
ncbi:MAG: hypothetical protein KKA42_16320 [candidate division Zixibacteria bacterium]|nr:hypothetical protein [candidate division Zixibacteria bacterium]